MNDIHDPQEEPTLKREKWIYILESGTTFMLWVESSVITREGDHITVDLLRVIIPLNTNPMDLLHDGFGVLYKWRGEERFERMMMTLESHRIVKGDYIETNLRFAMSSQEPWRVFNGFENLNNRDWDWDGEPYPIPSMGEYQPLHEVPEIYVINEFLTVKLEDVRGTCNMRKEINIYVKGERFQQCKYLLLNIPTDEEGMERQEEITSIDEAAEVLNGDMEGEEDEIREKYGLTHETEFKAHCSNLEAWAENGYDLRLIHTNLGFPLACKLVKVGCKEARLAVVEELTDRVLKNPQGALWLFMKYHEYLSKEELEYIIEELPNGLDKCYYESLRGLMPSREKIRGAMRRELEEEIITLTHIERRTLRGMEIEELREYLDMIRMKGYLE